MKAAQILICVGTGGVGKTTIASGLAIQAAMDGKKVLVLTIDPSQRLAQALGIQNSRGIVRVPQQNFKGELFASLVQHQDLFDGLVMRASVQYPEVKKLLTNKLYRQLTTTLSGSQEFTSLEALYQASLSQEYDLIVLDTPPSQHVLDFLRAPQKLIEILNKSSVDWLSHSQTQKTSLFKRLAQQGSQGVLKVLESLTGQEFISNLSQFFSHLGEWQGQLQGRIVEIQRLLASSRVSFCMVTGLSPSRLAETQELKREMKKNGFSLDFIVVNRALPLWYLKNEASTGLSVQESLKRFFKNQEERLEQYEKEQKISVYRIPEMTFDIKNFEDLKKFTQEGLIGSIFYEEKK